MDEEWYAQLEAQIVTMIQIRDDMRALDRFTSDDIPDEVRQSIIGKKLAQLSSTASVVTDTVTKVPVPLGPPTKVV